MEYTSLYEAPTIQYVLIVLGTWLCVMAALGNGHQMVQRSDKAGALDMMEASRILWSCSLCHSLSTISPFFEFTQPINDPLLQSLSESLLLSCTMSRTCRIFQCSVKCHVSTLRPFILRRSFWLHVLGTMISNKTPGAYPGVSGVHSLLHSPTFRSVLVSPIREVLRYSD